MHRENHMKRKNVFFVLAVLLCSLFASCSFQNAGLTGSVCFHVDGEYLKQKASSARSGIEDYDNLYMEISLLGDFKASRNVLLSGNENIAFDGIPVGCRIHAFAKVYKKDTAASGDSETVMFEGESAEISVADGKNELSLVLGRVTYYNVSVSPSPSSGGTVVPSVSKAKPGTVVTLSVSPESGYRLSTIFVKDGSETELTVTTVTEGAKYTFTMPDSNVSVSAEYALIDYSVVVPENIVFGELTSNTTSAKKGDTVTLTPKAGSGYVLASVSVKDSDGNPVSTTLSGSNYTFIMPASDVTAKAFFVKKFTESVKTIEGETNRVYFGDWPQSIMPSSVTIDESITTVRGGYTYYYGSDGCWYAKCIENANNSLYKYSDGTSVQLSTSNFTYTRYFKVEPIKWRVLTTDSGKRLLLSDQILINCAYYDSKDVDRDIGGVTVYPNNYKESRVRAFLNGLSYDKKTGESEQVSNGEFSEKGFLYTAFTNTAHDTIADTNVDNSATSANPLENSGKWNVATYICGNTDDKIFLLSEQEATTTGYGFDIYGNNDDARKIVTTDFAKANGAQQSTSDASYGGNWWLRSPSDSTGGKYVRRINFKGSAGETDTVKTSSTGVVPALYVKLN